MALTKFAAYSADGDLNAHVQNYTAGGTFAAGDVVKFSSGTIVVAAATDTKALGWALSDGSSGSDCVVLKADPGVSFVMASTGTEATTNVGVMYALSGTTGAQYMNIAETGHDLLTCLEIDIDNTLARVTIPSANSEAVTGA